MTAKDFKRGFNSRYVSSLYDTDTHSMVKDYIFEGILQCLVNQEKIIKMLESK